MTTLVLILQCAALGSALAFSTWYGLRASWWRSPEGRNIMGVSLAVAAVLVLIVLQQFFPDYPGRRVVQVVVYTTVALLFVQRTVQLERAQRRYRREA